MPHHQKTTTEQYCSKFNKAFKNGPHQKILKRKKKGVEAMDQQIKPSRRGENEGDLQEMKAERTDCTIIKTQ